ncbi:hypothetical protein [Vibrio panuliri]|uniref:Uncharacterized protein n=1 Tax=Vibrio panuliri TaxID=1381081 RepID=A0ABX3FI92_9VIBR|nr:hypothetical protein [Vibrio panuliri]KAB1457393.1 hypothetical protein F7O85_06530 [Vibrio panuliri]OLQ91445.1 hypothetical protein BIY20_01150 [Vibrio panuliri]
MKTISFLEYSGLWCLSSASNDMSIVFDSVTRTNNAGELKLFNNGKLCGMAEVSKNQLEKIYKEVGFTTNEN